jgi:hypothetical protein
MELLFLPTMGILARLESLAALLVASYEGTTLPVFAKLSVVPKKVRFTPKILEVMRINALCFVMLMIVGAPFCLEIEYVEVKILVLW